MQVEKFLGCPLRDRNNKMTTRSLIDQLENNFWQITIRLMSNSQMMRKVAKIGFTTLTTYKSTSNFWKTIFWAASGLTAGLFIGIIGSFILI